MPARTVCSRRERPEAATEDELRALARGALAHAYAPYSGFAVGAAVRAESGRTYVGVNVENASYGLTICAERSAVVQAVAAGERRLVACATDSARGTSAPCGACRQVLSEFMGADAPVHFRVEGEARTLRLGELLPGAFALAPRR